MMKAININDITGRNLLFQNGNFQMSCYTFEEDEGIPTHSLKGLAAVHVLSGTLHVSFVDGKSYTLTAGDVLPFDARVGHYVLAKEASKAILTQAQ